jgi:hypothetical protein
VRDITLGETIFLAFTTRAFATGIPTTLAGTPVVSAYVDAGLTQITAGITLGVDHDGVTGLNMLTVVATSGNGFANATDVAMVITVGTVGGVSVVGEVVGEFTIGRSAAAVDLANGTDGLGAIKADTAAILLDTATIDTPGEIATAVWSADATAYQVQGSFGQAIGDPAADTNTIYKAVVTDATGATVGADVVAMKVDTAAILVDTDVIGVAGAGLTNIGTIATVTTLTNLPAITSNWLTAAGIAATALNGKGDWNIGKTGYSLTQTFPANFADLAITVTTGRMTAGTIVDGAIGSATFAAGAINADAVATGAIDADALATDAVTEIADGVLDRNMATGTDSGTETVRTVRQAMRAARNKVAIAVGVATVYKEDDTTASWTAAITTSAGNPISTVDPASA